jgi:signal transduction histidine kinase
MASADERSTESRRAALPMIRRLVRDRVNSAFMLQLPITTTVLFALGWVRVSGAPVLDTLAFSLSVATLVVATGISILVTLRDSDRFWMTIPLLSMLAIALARIAIGPEITFALLLPVLWLALGRGLRGVVAAGVATLALVGLPYLWVSESGEQITVTALRLLVMMSVVTTVALVLNSVTADNRRKIEANEKLVDQREAALNDAVDLVRRLRENEAQLESAGHLFRSVLDSVTRQSVIGTDLSGLIDVWNTGAESMLGQSASDVIGKRYIHEFHLDDELEARAQELGYPAGATVLNPGFSALVEVARLGGSEDRDWSYIKGNGDTLAAHVAVTPRIDENGRTVGYIFVGTDVTDTKELAKLQDEFVGLVSHELRTPVSSILGYLELMRDSSDPLSDEQLQYLGVAERNAHRLLRLVGDLLFTAQVAAHKFPIETAETDVNAIVAAAVESARPSSQATNVLLLSKLQKDGRPIVEGDATRIAQACDNLLSNAIKFTPRGGTVTVAVETVGSVVQVAVRDTGMGIPPDEIAMLSTRFFRASTATRAAVQGVGLGLSITKAIVTAHGGSLSAESEVGVGTVFMFTLPLLRVDA